MSESIESIERIGFVGSGAAAGALARACSVAGLHVAAVSSRRFERAAALAATVPGCQPFGDAQMVVDRCEVVFLAVPDRAIEVVCQSLRWHRDQVALHCSGAHTIDLLASAAKAGALVGAMHPLQTFAGRPEDSERIAGSVIGIEAEEPLRTRLASLAERICARPIFLSAESKALYHASAVIISNYSVTLAALAAELWESFAISRDEALRALLPLLSGAVANLGSVGLPDALTGPIARGDVATLTSHLEAFARIRPQILPLYRELGYKTIELARERGLDPRAEEEMRALLVDSQGDDAVPDQRN